MSRGMYQVVCGGRHVNNQLQPEGEPCAKTYRHRNPDELHGSARAAGWSIATHDGQLHATCPSCRKPDPAIAALAKTIPAGRVGTAAATQDGER